jgi:predicted  nucleic acid-binding Zn-ribbon protein
MTANELTQLQNKIKNIELDLAKLEGVIETAKNQCLEKYGTSDISELEKKLEDEKTRQIEIEHQLESLYDKIKNSPLWDEV